MAETDAAQVTVVIAVHNAQRPLSRAVASCLTPALAGRVTVVVVCHNIEISAIRDNVGQGADAPITYLQLDDGLSSPAGPKNLGLSLCRTPYVMVLDSDDYLEAGALEHWLEVLAGSGSDGVIAPLKMQSGAIVRTPRSRLLRRRALDAVKDQLAYATAPRGVWSVGLLESLGFEYTPGLRTAEDLDPGLRLWFSGARLDFPSNGPHYVLGEDAGDRVTAEVMPLTQEFEAVAMLEDSWLAKLRPAQLQAIATKLVRIHLLGALTRRGPQWGWPEDDRAAVQAFLDRVRAISPDYAGPLTAAETALLAAVSAGGPGADAFQQALWTFEQESYRNKLLAPELAANLRRDSVLRHQLRLKAHAVLARLPRIKSKT